jgi:hypothetical protein
MPHPSLLHRHAAGWVDCVRKSYAAEGAPVFYRGLAATLGRAFLVNGAIFSAYELAHNTLSNKSGAAAAAPAAPAMAAAEQLPPAVVTAAAPAVALVAGAPAAKEAVCALEPLGPAGAAPAALSAKERSL